MESRCFVLVHGAWHGGWCWRDVRSRLEAEGNEVHTPTLPGLGERAALMSRDLTLTSMVDDVVAYLDERRLQDVVLVGHSFAGAVITGVADRASDRLASLVYLDAAVILDGETVFDTMPKATVATRRAAACEFDGGTSMPPPPGEVFGLGPSEQWAIERLSPHPLSSYESKLSLQYAVGNGLPVSYIACDAGYPTLDVACKRASAFGWPVRTLQTAHDAMILAPAETKALLLDRVPIRR